MSKRFRCLLLLAGLAAILPGQNLPWYLTGRYPAPSATGVPTNTSILLVEAQTVSGGSAYSLKSRTGAAAALGSARIYYTNVTLTPASPLSAFTQYTFTITPPASLGDPYSFDFTTGAGPDTAGPQLTGFDPPSGTIGTGVSGPFTALFNKRLMGVSASSQSGVSVRIPGGYSVQDVAVDLTPDGMGVIIQPLPLAYSGSVWPESYQITIDPTRFEDANGNSGQGIPQTAHYVTFAAPDASGAVLKSFFPADGDAATPLNVSIRLLFSDIVDSTTAAAGIVLSGGGTPVTVRVNSFASGYGVELKPVNLLTANQLYRVTVSSSLLDQSGLPAPASSFQFTTGTDPDLTPAQAVDAGPAYGPVWPSNVLVALRTNKRIMPLAALEYSTLGTPETIAGNGSVTGTATISSDGQTFIFAPAAPPAPGRTLTVNLADVVDVTGASFSGGVSYTCSQTADHEPPSVLAVNPPNGAQALSTTAPIEAEFSKPISIALSGDFPKLSAGGQRVPVTVRTSGALMTVTSPASLQPNTSYTLDLGGASDMSGNAMASYPVQFATGAAPVTGVVHLLSTSPLADTVGVDVNAPITFTFDAPLSPLAALSGFTVGDSTFGAYPATGTVAGGTLTITPTHPLLRNSAIQASVNTTDLFGRSAYANVLFLTGNYGDSIPFQVTSVSPPDGSTIDSPDRGITLTFSEAVNPASLAGSAITVYVNGQPVQAKVARTNRDLSLVVTPTIDNGTAILVVDPELIDIGGNPVTPFRASYTFSTAYQSASYATTLLAMRPPSGSAGVPANTAISLFLSNPVELATVSASLVVVADGQPIAGTYELSTDGKTLTFQPGAPFPAGAQVRFFQRTSIFTDTYGYNFTVAPPPPTTLSVVSYAPSGGGPVNSVVEVEFSEEVATGKNLIALQLPGYSAPGPIVPTTESHPRPHVLRLTPVSPLSPGYYLIVVSPHAGGGYLNLTMTAAVASPPPAFIAGPVPDAVGVPINASVRAAFNVPLNPLSVLPANFTIQATRRTTRHWKAIPFLVYLSDQNRSLVLTPTEALPVNAVVKVMMCGLEDQYGNALQPKSWRFTTGVAPQLTAPVLLQSSVPLTNPLPQLPANAALAFQFDRPLDPAVVTAPVSFNPQIPAQFTLSEDLRTLTLTAMPAWYKGQQYSLYLPEIVDLAGNAPSGGAYFRFYAAFDADLTPPKLVAASPNDGQTNMPLNTNIIAVFDKQVLSGSFGRVRLVQGTVDIPLTTMPDDLQRARLAPATPLQPQTTYTFVVEGITDLSGNVMAGTTTGSFTTGNYMDSTALNAVVYTGNYSAAATNIPICIVFSAAVSPATVDTRSVVLHKASAIASSYYWIPIPASPTLSSDGLSLILTPRDPLVPGWPYQVVVGSVRDFAGNPANSNNGTNMPAPTFYQGYGPDTTPPVAVIVPPDGSTGVPVNTHLGVFFSETILPQSSLFSLTLNGQPVPGSFQSGSSYFTPDFPLSPGATYRIDVPSVTDLAGNVSAPASSTFTVSTSTTPDFSSFQLLSTEPASNDVGVSVDAPIVMNFSRLVDPSSLDAASVYTTFPVSGSFSTSGSTVTFTPTDPWPSAASITVSLMNRFGSTVLDVAGNRLGYNNGFSFTTAATPSSTLPQLLSVSPEPGTVLTPPAVTFQLTFSETVSAGSGGLVVFSGSQQETPSLSYRPDNWNVLMANASVSANSQVTLFGSDAIVDRAGNPLAPFSYQYSTGRAEVNDRPTVTSVTPNTGATNVAPETPVKLTFNKPMDPVSLLSSVRLTQDGQNITGTLDSSDSNTGVQWTPGAPYAAGSRIDVFVLETAADPSGLTLGERYDSSFTVAAAQTAANKVEQTSFGGEVTAGAALELAFARPIDLSTVATDSVWLREGRKLVPGEFSLRGDRILRLVSSVPMTAGVEYVLTVGPGLRALDGTAARPEEFHFMVQPESSAAEVSGVQLTMSCGRAAVLVQFSEPVSPLSLDSVRLVTGDGTEIAVERRVSIDYRYVWLIPRDGESGQSVGLAELVRSSARIQLDEMPDRAGRVVKPGTHWPRKSTR
jgi:methionine-rich copper-binding protein CopC